MLDKLLKMDSVLLTIKAQIAKYTAIFEADGEIDAAERAILNALEADAKLVEAKLGKVIVKAKAAEEVVTKKAAGGMEEVAAVPLMSGEENGMNTEEEDITNEDWPPTSEELKARFRDSYTGSFVPDIKKKVEKLPPTQEGVNKVFEKLRKWDWMLLKDKYIGKEGIAHVELKIIFATVRVVDLSQEPNNTEALFNEWREMESSKYFAEGGANPFVDGVVFDPGMPRIAPYQGTAVRIDIIDGSGNPTGKCFFINVALEVAVNQ